MTARPKDRLGAVEEYTREALRKKGIELDFTIVSGDLCHLVGNKWLAQKKLDNFIQYRRLFGEYDFVFTGDSGQGDALFGAAIREGEHRDAVRGVFIHDVVATPAADREVQRGKGVVFFDTYAGAALEAAKVGLIGRDGLCRVADAAVEDFGRIEFPSQEMKRARQVELDRDRRGIEAYLAA